MFGLVQEYTKRNGVGSARCTIRFKMVMKKDVIVETVVPLCCYNKTLGQLLPIFQERERERKRDVSPASVKPSLTLLEKKKLRKQNPNKQANTSDYCRTF